MQASGQLVVAQVGRSVSIEQAARLLGLSRRTVYYRIRDGRLRTIRTIGGSQRVLLDTLEEQRQLAEQKKTKRINPNDNRSTSRSRRDSRAEQEGQPAQERARNHRARKSCGPRRAF